MSAVALLTNRMPVDEVSDRDKRIRALIDAQYSFVWRSLRRLGVPAGEAEDWAQEVFLAAYRRLNDIEPGRERGFLYRAAMNYAAHARRTLDRRREVPFEPAQQPCARRTPEDELHSARELKLFYVVLGRLSLDLRSVFILYELEQFTAPEIAEMIQLPLGTVASRLRRARKAFLEHARQVTADQSDAGGRGR